MTPTLHIDAGPRIEVRAIGAKISQKKLRKYVPIFEERTVDRDLLVEDSIANLYQSNGFGYARQQGNHVPADYLLTQSSFCT